MAAQTSAFSIEVLSSERIFPSHRPNSPSTVPLSIVDATVANFSPAGAIWHFDAHENLDPSSVSSHLRTSLTKVLDFYQPWTGELSWSSHDPSSHDHTKRFRRLCLSWGSPSDPGVEFVTASAPENLADLIPHAKERAKSIKEWDHTNIKLSGLLPPTQLALRHLQTTPNAPVLAIQLTNFGCGGFAIGIVLTHPVADATSLRTFVRDWSEVNRAVLGQKPLPTISPLFDPQQIDRAAAGEIDGETPDPSLVQISRDLPSIRYDWWTKGDPCPWPTATLEEKPPGYDPANDPDRGIPIPWSNWNTELPCSAYILHFTGREVTRIWEEATTPSSPVSRHDALLAYISTLVNRARGLQNDQNPVHMDISIGLRQRVSPRLPDEFLGSPIVMVNVQLSGHEAATAPLSEVANKIRTTQQQFNNKTMPALLHDMIYQQCPQRIWRGFLGPRNLMVTSWVHLKLYEIDFGFSIGQPRYVEPVLTVLDGLVQLMEQGAEIGTEISAATQIEGGSHEPPPPVHKVHWSDPGVDVALSLETEAMQRLLQDPLLRRYE